MALSARQVELIQANFTQVEPIADAAAEIFYTQLFENDPELKYLFKSDMTNQGRKLMSTLKVAIMGLNKLDEVVPVLQKLAVRHLDYGVRASDYTKVGNALLKTLKLGLGDEFTPEARSAWVALYKVVADVMKDAAYK